MSKSTYIHAGVKIQLLVDSVTSNLTEVITLVREEEVLNHLTSTLVISRVCITQLTVDICNSFLF